MNQKAPELVIEKWLTEKPETNGKFLVVIGLSDETEEKIGKLKSPKIEYYSAIDTEQRLQRNYEIKAIPHCVIIDPNGTVVWEGWPQQEGFELTEETVSNLIKNY